VIVAFSSAGLPGLNGFVGEYLILVGSFKTLPWYTVVAASGVILAALYLLWLVQRVFFGPLDKEENKNLPDMKWNELAAVIPLLVFIVWIGVYPNTFLKKMEPSVRQLLLTVENHHAASERLAATAAPAAPTASPVDGVSR